MLSSLEIDLLEAIIILGLLTDVSEFIERSYNEIVDVLSSTALLQTVCA